MTWWHLSQLWWRQWDTVKVSERAIDLGFTNHHVKDSADFVEDLKDGYPLNTVSLTSIPTEEEVKIIGQQLSQDHDWQDKTNLLGSDDLAAGCAMTPLVSCTKGFLTSHGVVHFPLRNRLAQGTFWADCFYTIWHHRQMDTHTLDTYLSCNEINEQLSQRHFHFSVFKFNLVINIKLKLFVPHHHHHHHHTSRLVVTKYTTSKWQFAAYPNWRSKHRGCRMLDWL